MRSITISRALVSGALALGALATIGGFTPAVADPSASPFAGSWSGTMTITDSVDPDWQAVGTFTWEISEAGQVAGAFYVVTLDIRGRFTGHLRDDGKLNIVMVKDVGGGVPHNGAAETDGDGGLVASATDAFSDVKAGVHTWAMVATRDSD